MTFFTSLTKSGVEVAFRHLRHVVLVEKLALIPLLAKAPQPMLANDGFVPPDVTKGAGGALGALGADVILAHGRAWLVHARKGQWQGPNLQMSKKWGWIYITGPDFDVEFTWRERHVSISKVMWSTLATSWSILDLDFDGRIEEKFQISIEIRSN